KQEVARGNVEAIYNQGQSIEGRFAAAVTWPPPGEPSQAAPGASRAEQQLHQDPRTSETFTTVLPAFVDNGLEAFLIEHEVEISAVPIQTGASPIATLLFGFGPAILLIAAYVWLFRRAQQGMGGMGGMMGIGKGRARRYDQESAQKVTFDDVAGIDEAENELVEIVDFLKDPAKYQ